MDYETAYSEILKEVMTLRRQLRAERVKNTLANLACRTAKSFHLENLERNLEKELHGLNRGDRIDLLIELIQDYI